MKLELIKEHNDKLEVRYSVYKDNKFITWSNDKEEMLDFMDSMLERFKSLPPKEVLKTIETEDK